VSAVPLAYESLLCRFPLSVWKTQLAYVPAVSLPSSSRFPAQKIEDIRHQVHWYQISSNMLELLHHSSSALLRWFNT
jgi:hypothetical protein